MIERKAMRALLNHQADQANKRLTSTHASEVLRRYLSDAQGSMHSLHALTLLWAVEALSAG